jgi:hypothetical protein
VRLGTESIRLSLDSKSKEDKMQNLGNNRRGGGNMRRVTRMQRAIDNSGFFKAIRDEGAGMRNAPRWRKRYKLTGTEYYLYLLFDEQYRIQFKKGGFFVEPSELVGKVDKSVSDFLTTLDALAEEIHGSSEE